MALGSEPNGVTAPDLQLYIPVQTRRFGCFAPLSGGGRPSAPWDMHEHTVMRSCNIWRGKELSEFS